MSFGPGWWRTFCSSGVAAKAGSACRTIGAGIAAPAHVQAGELNRSRKPEQTLIQNHCLFAVMGAVWRHGG